MQDVYELYLNHTHKDYHSSLAVSISRANQILVGPGSMKPAHHSELNLWSQLCKKYTYNIPNDEMSGQWHSCVPQPEKTPLVWKTESARATNDVTDLQFFQLFNGIFFVLVRQVDLTFHRLEVTFELLAHADGSRSLLAFLFQFSLHLAQLSTTKNNKQANSISHHSQFLTQCLG